MSSKEAKPTLGGARIKTRKRNIAVPLDPESFTDTIHQIWNNAEGEGNDTQKKLEGFVKVLENSDLDFSRYGDTLFEILFAGGRMAAGSVQLEDGQTLLEAHVLLSGPTKAEQMMWVTCFQKIIRRRPFLIKNLENIMRKLIQSLEHFSPENREKMAVFTCLVFSQKLGMPPENIFSCLLNESMVSKGSPLTFLTTLFKEWLSDGSLDELVALLRRAKVDDQLLEFFPMHKRNIESFEQHFNAAGLEQVVRYHQQKDFDVKLKELHATVTEMISENAAVTEVIDFVRAKHKEAGLPDVEVVRYMWDSIMNSIQWSGKNQQQNSNNALRQVRAWSKLLRTVAPNAKLEAELMNKVQIHCYEDAKLMKLFPDIIKLLYDADVLAEDTITTWFRKGTNPKGR
eukprot:jgi/Mesvir1/15847/Mv03395-RA.1